MARELHHGVLQGVRTVLKAGSPGPVRFKGHVANKNTGHLANPDPAQLRVTQPTKMRVTWPIQDSGTMTSHDFVINSFL